MNAIGTFTVTLQSEPPYDASDGVSLSRASFAKRFAGALTGTSTGQMLSARTPFEGSAGYVAIERVTGTLDAKRGSFVLQHSGAINRGEASLVVTVVPDSGTGELVGLSGRMEIRIECGIHHYAFEYGL